MNVDSIFFISCFLPLSLAVYFVIPNLRVKNYILLALGLLFYSFGSLSGLVVLLAAATVNYLFGLWLKSCRFRRQALALGVTVNLLFLAFYKYLGFLLNEVFGFRNIDLGLAVPLGISFFTFKSISYLVDTYRASENGTKNYFDVFQFFVWLGENFFRRLLQARLQGLRSSVRNFQPVRFHLKMLLSGCVGL